MYSALTCLALSLAALPPELEAQLRGLLGAQSLTAYQEPALLVQTRDGQGIGLPPGPMEAQVDINGFLATTWLRYTFTNPTDAWLEATFVHPVPERGAVDMLRMLVAERVIEGVVQEKQQAQRTFEEAKAAGKVAAVSHQLRPDLFSTTVANIPPHGNVIVELGIRETLRYQDEAFEYRLPLAVNPRFSPFGSPHRAGSQRFASVGQAQAAALESSIRVSLQSGVPLDSVTSPSHEVTTSLSKAGTLVHVNKARLSGDFVLRWAPRLQQGPIAAAFTEEIRGHTYAALMVLPPPAAQVELSGTARELIFVVDTSGSMGGPAMRQAKAALRASLSMLRASDSFEIIEFDSSVTRLFGRAVLANDRHLKKAHHAVDSLSADGGTMMQPALEAAFGTSSDQGPRLRQIVFITDGAIGNGQGLLQLIRGGLNGARLFTVGIGSAPNARFMRKAAQAGRGSASFINNTSEVQTRMVGLFDRLSRPAATDSVVDWGQAAETALEPLPDLYAGEPLFVLARLQGPASLVSVRGRVGTDTWQATLLPQPLNASEASGSLSKLWARRRIEALLDSTAIGESEEDTRPAVLKLALEHQLVSPFTSFVAVDVTPARPQGASTLKGEVPSHLAEGRSISGTLPNSGTDSTVWTVFGMIAVVISLGFRLRERS